MFTVYNVNTQGEFCGRKMAIGLTSSGENAHGRFSSCPRLRRASYSIGRVGKSGMHRPLLISMRGCFAIGASRTAEYSFCGCKSPRSRRKVINQVIKWEWGQTRRV